MGCGTIRLKDDAALADLLKGSHLKVAGDTGAKRSTVPAILRPREPKQAPRVAEGPKDTRSGIHKAMSEQIREAGIARPIEWPTEYYPLPPRLWRLDFAWPDRKLALEVDGGVHCIQERWNKEFERKAALLLAGWRVLYVGPDQIKGGMALFYLQQLMEITNGEKENGAQGAQAHANR